MAQEITGKLSEIFLTVQISERYKKREFILDITEEVNGNSYPNFAKFQASQNKCDVLDSYKVGETVKVHFNIRGNNVESKKDGKTYNITNLDVWKIERVNSSAGLPTRSYQAPQSNTGRVDVNANPIKGNNESDLPF